MEDFDSWICTRLLALESDDSVITDYIKGILTGEESQDEKQEALEGILSGIMEVGVEEFCHEIFSKWNQLNSAASQNGAGDKKPKVDFEDQLSKIMEQQNISATVVDKPKIAVSDKKLKEAILKQYAEISDCEDEDEADDEGADMPKNSNREEVAKEEQERRERLKAQSAAKREKDKLDREKQKQEQVERKDKEKKRTAKTEKRR